LSRATSDAVGRDSLRRSSSSRFVASDSQSFPR